jgi:hypothetical protein
MGRYAAPLFKHVKRTPRTLTFPPLPSGDLKFDNLKFKTTALDDLGLPFKVGVVEFACAVLCWTPHIARLFR